MMTPSNDALPPSPPLSEREQTDESLRIERENADHALQADLAALDELADGVARARCPCGGGPPPRGRPAAAGPAPPRHETDRQFDARGPPSNAVRRSRA